MFFSYKFQLYIFCNSVRCEKIKIATFNNILQDEFNKEKEITTVNECHILFITYFNPANKIQRYGYNTYLFRSAMFWNFCLGIHVYMYSASPS